MGSLDKFAVAAALREIAALLELKGENRFRAGAFERGARAVEQLRESLGTLVAEEKLTEKPGIGAALAKQITELHTTGTSDYLERLRKEMPPGVIQLSRVPHMTVARIEKLHAALGIASVDELRAACEAGRVRTVPGFGAKTEAKILAGINAPPSPEDESILLVEAIDAAVPIASWLGSHADEVILAGGIRRSLETMDGIDVVAASATPEKVIRAFEKHPALGTVEHEDATSIAAWIVGGPRVRLIATTPAKLGPTLLRATGSPEHLAQLEARAEKLGVKLAGRTEEAIYDKLGVPFVPPELREGLDEIGASFDDLLADDDVQGLVHCHTVYSDGKHTIEEMARAAEKLGMKYITITDHSPTAFYANGVEIDRLRRQWDEIEAVQEKVKGVKILRGTESDILDSGALDYPDAVLEKLDVVIASVHSKMKMDEETMTRRLVNAMRQPVFKIWGHALGRLLHRRAPYACRVEEVLDAIAESRAAIEINGDPYRLDMEPRWLRAARERNIRFVISTDAHSMRALRNFRFGVGLARRAGIRKTEVLNASGPAAFAKAVRPAA